MSAGRLYDKISDDKDFAEVKFISGDILIAKIVDEERLEELKEDPENDVHYLLDLKVDLDKNIFDSNSMIKE